MTCVYFLYPGRKNNINLVEIFLSITWLIKHCIIKIKPVLFVYNLQWEEVTLLLEKSGKL